MDIGNKRKTRVLIILLLGSLVSVAGWRVTIAEEDEKKPSMRLNPVQSDPYEELMRHRNEGSAYYESGILKKAMANFSAAAKLKENSLAEIYNLGLINRKLDNIKEARKLLKQAIKLDDTFANSYYVLALMDKQEGKSDAAISLFKKAMKRAPTDPSSYYQLGLLLRDKGKDQEALQLMVNALQLNPYHTGALYQLYQSYHQSGQIDKAKLTMKEFSRIKKSVSRSRKQLNDEESALSSPLTSDRLAVSDNKISNEFKASFNKTIKKISEPISAFSLHNLDDDIQSEIVAITNSGMLWLISSDKDRKLNAKKLGKIAIKSKVTSLLVERFSVKETARFVVSSQQGLAISSPDFLKSPVKLKWLSKVAEGNVQTIDIDHDGDLDLISLATSTVYVNRGNGRFTKKAKILGSAEIKSSIKGAKSLIGSDFVNRISVDMVAYNNSGTRYFLQDATGGRYALKKDVLPKMGGISWLGKGDLNNDGMMDLVGTNKSQLFIDTNLGEFKFSNKIIGKSEGVINGQVADFDNDGRLDVLLIHKTGEITLWRNHGEAGFKRIALSSSQITKSTHPAFKDDLDDDGKIDVIALSDKGQLVTWWNDSQGVGKWMKLDLIGMRSPPSGQMTQVEIRRGSWYSKYESNGLPVQIGLGDANYTEILRLSWPNGFIESKFKIDEIGPWRFEESERISGSCPSVYAWDGKRFNFITDAFISGPMGVPVSADQYFPVDHDEYVKIPGEALKRNGDRYQLRITEELREAVFLDKVQLLMIDHPVDVTVYPNERLAPPPFPEFGIHATRHARPSTRVIDHRNNDVTRLVAAVDDTYPTSIARLQYTGFSEPQGVTVALPDGAASSKNLRLFLTGWFYYFDSTSMISASQRPDMKIIWPQIQVKRNDQWETITYTGIPSGKGKTVIVDLTGKLPANTQEIRVWTNVELYWDQILIDVSAPPEQRYTTREAPLLSAHLRFRGFSQLLAKTGPQPDRFDYNKVRYTALWNPLKGKYTRYGDVKPLLGREDSQMVVFGSGDELVLEFDAPKDEPSSGNKRDFFLYLNGFVKDGDKYTAHAGRVDPVPFVGMTQYPYDTSSGIPKPFRTEEYKQYQKLYQTREPLQFTGPILSAWKESGQ